MPDAKIQLRSTAGAGTPTFTLGCGSGNGTSACDLGAVDATSAQRLFQAEVNVPLTAATITAVSLTVTGSAANLTVDPAATSSVAVLAPASPVGANLSSLSAMPPPGVAAPTPPPTLPPTVSPGGSAAGLFPSVAPGSPQAGSPQAEGAKPVANVSALSPGGTPMGSEIAEVTGLAALVVAMVLAVTRVSFRRPAPRHAANSTVAAALPSAAPAEGQE